jgi:hypothetical protein
MLWLKKIEAKVSVSSRILSVSLDFPQRAYQITHRSE